MKVSLSSSSPQPYRGACFPLHVMKFTLGLRLPVLMESCPAWGNRSGVSRHVLW
jgi:hypothetical protein